MEKPKPSYFAVIPADVRYSKSIPDGAKLLFGEITVLCGAEWYCWAEDSYFAELYGKDERTIRRWISALESEWFVEAVKNAWKREIRIWTKMSKLDKNVQEFGQKCPNANTLSNNTRTNNAQARVRTWEDKNKKTEEYESMWETFVSENPNAESRPASISVYLCMRELGYRPTEPPEAFRKWLAELGTLKGCTAKELEDVATEWKLYWMARPEKPVKNHKTSYMNSVTFSKKTWTNESSKK